MRRAAGGESPLPLPRGLAPERAARLAGAVRRLLEELDRLWELPGPQRTLRRRAHRRTRRS